MFTTKAGKHFNNPQQGMHHDKMAGSKSEPSNLSESGEANEPEMQHSSETHGTVPHPVTGVHAVHVHHHGEGQFKTHTHHDGGHIETQHHGSMAEVHAHVAKQLPDQNAEPGDTDMNDEMEGPSHMADLSGMMGGE